MVNVGEKISPETIRTIEDVTKLPLVPFYISDYVPDAVDRLRDVMPLSVRDRKTVARILEDESGFDIDPKDENDFYGGLLSFLEEEPWRFITLDMNFTDMLPERKRRRTPASRIFNRIGQPNEWDKLRDTYLSAASAGENDEALFFIFLSNCISASLSHARHQESGTGTEDAYPQKADLDEVFAHRAEEFCETTDPTLPVPENLVREWRRLCADLENIVGEMGEKSEASRVVEAREMFDRMAEICEAAREAARSKAVRAASQALATIWAASRVAGFEAYLETFEDSGLSEITARASECGTKLADIRQCVAALEEAEQAAEAAIARRDWDEVGRLSGEAKRYELAKDAAVNDSEPMIASLIDLLCRTIGAEALEELGALGEQETLHAVGGLVAPYPFGSVAETTIVEPDEEAMDATKAPKDVANPAEPVEESAAEEQARTNSAHEESGELADGSTPSVPTDPPHDGKPPEVSLPSPGEVTVPADPSTELIRTRPEILFPGDRAGVEPCLAGLITSDTMAIAARFSEAVEAHDVPCPIGADVLSAAAVSLIGFDGYDGYDTGASNFAVMINAAATANVNDGLLEQRRAALLFGSILRPAILMPELQMRQYLSDLKLRSYGPALGGLQKAIGELDYSFAPTLDDLANAAGKSPVSRLATLKQDLAEWKNRAQMRTGPCQPSTAVMNIVVRTGRVGKIVDAILMDDPRARDEVEAVIDEFANDSAILTRVKEINRSTGTRSKGRFPKISNQYMARNIGEGIDLLRRWRNVARREGRRNPSETGKLASRVSHLRGKIETAIAEFARKVEEEANEIDRAIGDWVIRRLKELRKTLDGQDTARFTTLVEALGDELDLLPVGCQPTDPSALRMAQQETGDEARNVQRAEADSRVIEAVLEGHVMVAEDSFEDKISVGAFAVAERLVPKLETGEDARRVRRERIRTARNTMLDDLETQVMDLSRTLKDQNKIDVKSQDWIGREIDALDAVMERIAEWRTPSNEASEKAAAQQGPVEAFEIHAIIERAKKLVGEVRQTIQTDQTARLAQIAHDQPDMKTEIAQLRSQIGTMSPETVEDRLALIRDGRPIGQIEDRAHCTFEAFFPGFLTSASAADWPADIAGYEAAFAAKEAAGGAGKLAIAQERRAAATALMAAWIKLARQIQSDVSRPAAINGLLEALTFTEPTTREAVRISGVRQACLHETHMTFQSKDWFCPPEFGSKAGHRYRVCVIGPHVLFEQIDGSLEPDLPTMVLVADRMSVEKRREFAQKLRHRRVPALLVDESLCAFVAISKTVRLETLFECALPFGRFEPYTTAAGRLPSEMFFGREQEINKIFRKEVDGCLVYGGRQLGKSALLGHVEELYHNPAKGVIVKRREVNSIGGEAEPAGRIWAVIAQMLGEFGIVSDAEASESGVTTHIKDWLRVDSSRRIILLLDEVDRFMSSEARHGYPNLIQLKALMEETFRSFKVVFAGLHNVRRMLAEPNSPLAHFGTPICIGPLNATYEDKASARRLVIDPMRAAGFAFEDSRAAEDILAYVNHYPSLVQTFCKRLLTFLHQRNRTLGEGPLWKIPHELLFKGEGFDEIRQDIREKFQLTLNLDPRYALIANVLGLLRSDIGDERVLRTGLSPTEIREEAHKHWPSNIQTIDNASFKALLDELFELGVLGRIGPADSSQSNYVLRTRQVAQMLGSDNDIIESILNIEDLEAEIDYDASSYRRAYVPKGPAGDLPASDMKRNPLTDSQMGVLLHRQYPGCRFVAGLSALGLRDVPGAVEAVIGPGQTWGDIKGIEVATVSNIRSFRKEIDNAAKGQVTTRVLKLLFMRPEEKEVEKLISFAERSKQVISGVVRPVFLLDVANDKFRDIAIRREAIVLMPWGHEMLRAYLREVEATNLDTREQRKELLRLTGGVPSTLCQVVNHYARYPGRISPEDLAKKVPGSDFFQIRLSNEVREALATLEETDTIEDYETMIELLCAGTTFRGPEDIVPDLKMLGIVQAHDPLEGYLSLSALGQLMRHTVSETTAVN